MTQEENQIRISEGAEGFALIRNTELERFAGTCEVVSIYSNNEESDKFAAGFIRAVSDTHIIIAHISARGLYDGFLLKEAADIYRLEYGGEYEKKLKSLYELESQGHNSIDCNSADLISDLLIYAQQNCLVITAETYHSDKDDLQGYVKEVDPSHAKIRLVNDYGNMCGDALVDLMAITHICCDSEHEMGVRLLSGTR